MLTERQIQLLNTIINEYVESSEPVGSQILVQKYKLRYSPATVRNEMAKLIEEGFLEMIHTSSGRVPTSMAYRIFLTDLMEEEDMPVLQEVAMKQKLWPARFEFEKMLRQTAVALSDVTKEMAFLTSKDGFLSSAGSVNLLDHREFWDIETAKEALNLSDRYELVEQALSKSRESGDVKCMIGDEIGINKLQNCGIVFSEYDTGKKSGYVAVMGPSRMKYQRIIPAVRNAKNLIEELAGSW